MMARSPVSFGNGRLRSIEGLEKLAKRAAALPEALRTAITADMDKIGDLIVSDIKRVAPVSELTAHPGELRDSVHKEPGQVPMEVRVVEDARDPQGRFIGKHVEHGHKTPSGVHVAGVPHFWPAYRVNKKRIRARVARSINKAVKATKAP